MLAIFNNTFRVTLRSSVFSCLGFPPSNPTDIYNYLSSHVPPPWLGPIFWFFKALQKPLAMTLGFGNLGWNVWAWRSGEVVKLPWLVTNGLVEFRLLFGTKKEWLRPLFGSFGLKNKIIALIDSHAIEESDIWLWMGQDICFNECSRHILAFMSYPHYFMHSKRHNNTILERGFQKQPMTTLLISHSLRSTGIYLQH